jgi:molecular chaperone DnaK
VTPEDRAQVEAAVSDLKDALKADDKELLETKSKALAEASAGLAQKAYEQAQQDAGEATADAGAADDGVVDAEFEEVKEDESKS